MNLKHGCVFLSNRVLLCGYKSQNRQRVGFNESVALPSMDKAIECQGSQEYVQEVIV